MSSNEIPVVALHASPGMEDQIVDWFDPLYQYLGDQGALPIVTIGKDSFDPQTGSFGHYFSIEHGSEGGSPSITPVEASITADSAYNTTGGLSGERLPMLNHPRLRKLGSDRWEVYKLLPEVQPDTRLLRHDRRSELADVVSEMSVPQVAVRPVRESLSRNTDNLYRGSVDEISQSILEATTKGELPEDEDLVVQADEWSSQLPSSLRAADEKQAAALSGEHSKSLRLYLVDRKLLVGVAALTLSDGPNQLVFVDQDSIPTEAIEKATTMNDLLRDRAEVDDSYMAINEYWDADSGEWKIIDTLVRRPAFIRDHQSLEGAAIQRQGVGNKLIGMALRSIG